MWCTWNQITGQVLWRAPSDVWAAARTANYNISKILLKFHATSISDRKSSKGGICPCICLVVCYDSLVKAHFFKSFVSGPKYIPRTEMGNSYSAKIWSVKPKAGAGWKGWGVFVRKKAESTCRDKQKGSREDEDDL